MMYDPGRWTGVALALSSSLLAACTGGVGERGTQKGTVGGQTYPVTLTVSGLNGTGLVLQNNGGDNLLIPRDGTYGFPAGVVQGGLFNVSVLTQPGGTGSLQTCKVTQGAGVASGAITGIQVQCAPKQSTGATIGGSVAGLMGGGLVLQNSDGTQIPVSANGSFTIATNVAPGTPYAVTVLGQPVSPDQVCTVVNSSGTTAAADIGSIVVTCRPGTPGTAYSVGGRVTGLAQTGTSIQLTNNGRDPLTLSADGPFTFGLLVPSGGTYSVAAPVAGGSRSVTCTLGAATGVVTTANINDITVTCQVAGGEAPAPVYTVGGTVTGLTGTGATLVLRNNGGDPLTLTRDGPFTFNTALFNGSAYAITAQTSTPALSCPVTSGSGTIAGADVSVQVSCQAVNTDPSSLTVAITGLPADLTARVAAGTAQPLVVSDAFEDFRSFDANGETVVAAGTLDYFSAFLDQQPGRNRGDGQTDVACTLSLRTGSGARRIEVQCVDHPLGFLYVTNGGDGTVSNYVIAGDGTPVPFGIPLPVLNPADAPSLPVALTGTSFGFEAGSFPYLYVADAGARSLSRYQLDNNTGVPQALDILGSYTGIPASLSIYDEGYLLLANGSVEGSIELYFTPAASFPVPAPAAVGHQNTGDGNGSSAMARPFDVQNGCTRPSIYAYVANSLAGTVNAYVAGEQALTPAGSYQVGPQPQALSVLELDDGTGTVRNSYLYVTSRNGAFTPYSINCADGSLTPLQSTLSLGEGVDAVSPMALLHPDRERPFLYETIGTQLVAIELGSEFTEGPGYFFGAGMRTPVPPGPIASFGDTVYGAVAPSLTSQTVTLTSVTGRIQPGMLVTDSAGVIPRGTTVQSISADQTTLTLSQQPEGGTPFEDVLSVYSAFVYAVDPASNLIRGFRADPLTGALTPLDSLPVSTGPAPTAIYTTRRP